MSWKAKSEVITVSTFKQKFCYYERIVGRKGGGGEEKNTILHSKVQSLCSEKKDEQILTSHVYNGRIGMCIEVSNEIGVFHWNTTHAGWNSSQVVLLYPLFQSRRGTQHSFCTQSCREKNKGYY